jgi:hypothetical protein
MQSVPVKMLCSPQRRLYNMSEDPKVVPLKEGIDFNQQILDMNGDALKAAEDETIRLGSICVNALMGTYEGDKADGTVKLKRFNLAQKIGDKDGVFPTLHLNSKQKRLVLDMAEQVYMTLLYARIHEALEGTTDDNEETD